VQPGYPQQGHQYPAPGQMPTAPQFPPSYAPNPNVPAAPPVPQNVAELGFSDPSGGVANPTARHLDGRTIVIVPKRVDEQAKYQGQDRPTAYFDMYVVDGGPIMYGDSEDRANPRPFTHTIETPAYFADAMSGNVLFVNEVKSKIGPNGQPTGMALGVVQRGTRGNKPWLLTRCEKDVDGNERPGGEARRRAAMQLVFAHRSGEWQPPRATPLAQAATPPVAPVQYTPQQYGAPAGYVNVPSPQFAQVAPGVQTNVTPASAVPAPPTGYPPAPGWENNPTWGQFTPDQQSAIWQQFQQAQSNQPQSAPSASNGAAPAAGQAFPPGAAGTAPTGPGW
jgi:hypothetical protein